MWFRKEKVPEQGIKSNKSCNSLTLFANLDIENFSNAGIVNHNNILTYILVPLYYSKYYFSNFWDDSRNSNNKKHEWTYSLVPTEHGKYSLPD